MYQPPAPSDTTAATLPRTFGQPGTTVPAAAVSDARPPTCGATRVKPPPMYSVLPDTRATLTPLFVIQRSGSACCALATTAVPVSSKAATSMIDGGFMFLAPHLMWEPSGGRAAGPRVGAAWI